MLIALDLVAAIQGIAAGDCWSVEDDPLFDDWEEDDEAAVAAAAAAAAAAAVVKELNCEGWCEW